jgi:hypothetical protein
VMRFPKIRPIQLNFLTSSGTLVWDFSSHHLRSFVRSRTSFVNLFDCAGMKHVMPTIISALLLMCASLLPASAFSPPSAHKSLFLRGRIHANGVAEGYRTGILAVGSLGERSGRDRAMMGLRMGAEEPSALRTMFGDKGGPPWACVNKCGACCELKALRPAMSPTPLPLNESSRSATATQRGGEAHH